MESRFETSLQQKVAEEVKSYIASLSSLNIPPILEIKPAPTQQQPILHSMIIKEPKICRLAMEDDDGNLFIVADGTVHPCDDGVVHSSKLLPDHYKVSIDNPYEEHKLVTLPVPSPDGETEFGKSKGYFVQWPISMVVFDEMDNALKTLSQSKEQVGSCDPYRSQESGVSLDNQLALFDVGDLDMDTSEISLLKMIMLEENPDTIVVPIKAPLLYYQENKDIWVTSNDISEMMNGAWLNVSIFHVYILYLIEDLRDKGQGERITFLCPEIISGDECKRDFFGAIAYLKHAFTCELQKKESSHCKFILAPYKEECHWILLVVDLRAGVVFEFDSLAQQATRPTLLLCENALKYAYKSYRARLKGQSNNTTLLFKQIKCAQQPGGIECGYYVMRFMYEIVNQYSQCMGDLAQGLKASALAFENVKSGIWVNLLRNDPDTTKIRHIIEDGLSVRIGNGESTSFWHDKWVSNGPLKDLFPRLFSISEHGNAMVNQMGMWRNGAWVWELSWRRQLYDWEKNDLDRLMLLIMQVSLVFGENDGAYWHENRHSKFPIKDIVDRFYSSHTPILSTEVCRIIWKMKVPPRAQFTLWLANLERLKTGDMLVNLGIIDYSNGQCPFCDSTLETNSHILFTCAVSWRIWMDVLAWWGVVGVLHFQCPLFTISWRSLKPSRCNVKLWNLILGCIIWSLWYERNKIKFEQKACNPNIIVSNLKMRIVSWAKELLGVDLAWSLNFSTCPRLYL